MMDKHIFKKLKLFVNTNYTPLERLDPEFI